MSDGLGQPESVKWNPEVMEGAANQAAAYIGRQLRLAARSRGVAAVTPIGSGREKWVVEATRAATLAEGASTALAMFQNPPELSIAPGQLRLNYEV